MEGAVMRNLIRLFAAAVLFTFPTLSFAASYKIDPDHSDVGFKIRHMMVSNVKGTFRAVSGKVKIDDSDLSKSSVMATMETASIDTGVEKRDNDLRSANYFDVAKYPTMTFTSSSVAAAGEGKLKVSGALTLHGVTRPVVLDVVGPSAEMKDPRGNIRRGASASTKISRKDFGMTAGTPLVGDEVEISIEIEMIRIAGE
jgi:polyisoprenoid-binding protein YceI